jgi:hypothetical protein
MGGVIVGGVPAGSVITGRGTGTGGLGTYYTNAASGTPTAIGTTVETGYIALSAGQPGELVKISRRLNV